MGRAILWLVVVEHALAVFVAVGTNSGSGAIFTSANALAGSWVSRPCPMSASVFGVAFGPSLGVWVAVGRGTTHTIASSADSGQTWTGQSNSVFNAQGWGVAWGQGKFVAVGEGGNSAAVSTDGTTFAGLTIFTLYGVGVAFGGSQGRWVAVGAGVNQIATSLDAQSWQGAGAGIFGVGLCVAFGGGVWVAGGQGSDTLASSPDGMLWTGRGSSVFSQCIGVAFGNGVFVATGSGSNTLAYSSDGITFTGLGMSTFSATGNGAAFGGSVWIILGRGNYTLATSMDGLNFTGQGGVFTMFGSGATSDLAPVATLLSPTTSPETACASLPSCTCSGSVCTSTVPVTSNGTLSLSTSSTLMVQGNLTLLPSSAFVASLLASPIRPLSTSSATAIVDGTLQLVVGPIPSGTVIVLQAVSVVGTFAMVQTTSSSACVTVTSSLPVYSPTTVTVMFQTAYMCSQPSLPTGAIVGIAVGAVVVAIVGVVTAVSKMRQRSAREDAKANAQILRLHMEAAKVQAYIVKP